MTLFLLVTLCCTSCEIMSNVATSPAKNEMQEIETYSPRDSETESIDKTVADIYDDIYSIEDYEIIQTDVFGYSTEGGTVTAVKFHNELQYIQVQLFGEMGQLIIEYTFDSKHILINRTSINYSQPMYLFEEKIEVESINLIRYLLINETLYELDADANTLLPVDSETANIELELLNEFCEAVNIVEIQE